MKTTPSVVELYAKAAAYHARKRAQCLRIARECSRSSWQYPEDRAEFLLLKREAMTDARAWSLRP